MIFTSGKFLTDTFKAVYINQWEYRFGEAGGRSNQNDPAVLERTTLENKGKFMFREWPTFEELRKAAEENPEALEQFRQQEIQAIISSAPETMQRRLQGIQFQIDCKRRIHKASPLGSCISISKMMYQSVAQLQDVMSGTCKSEPETGNARVLSFPVSG